MLTVGLATDSLEVVTMYNSLESLTFGSTDDIHELDAFIDNVGERDGVTEFKLSREVHRELYELLFGSGSCLFEVPHKRRAGPLFLFFAIGKLYSGITIFFYCTHLCDNARTSLNDGAWYIFTISTENGSHSDFLSN